LKKTVWQSTQSSPVCIQENKPYIRAAKLKKSILITERALQNERKEGEYLPHPLGVSSTVHQNLPV
jgi:hypothetical protein